MSGLDGARVLITGGGALIRSHDHIVVGEHADLGRETRA
jgi:hypothetical protein